FLQSFNISRWYNRHYSYSFPLRYLGYPIFFSHPQKTLFFDQLITKIRNACQIHSQRQLSICGRATVFNSLILARLWHLFRLFSITKAQCNAIKSIISKFVNQSCIPSYSRWTRRS
ncbi:hypothetical protein BDF21DRAFT_392618, partial [Thamnidium elegans]